MKLRSTLLVLTTATAACGIGIMYSRREIHTLKMSVTRAGDLVAAEGSWKKAGGHGMVVPELDTAKIRCDVRAGECKEDAAEVNELVSGYRTLQLLETQEYRITSWDDGTLVARAIDSSGGTPTGYDVILRISVKDKTVTRTWHGKRSKFVGNDMDLSSDWLEEILK